MKRMKNPYASKIKKPITILSNPKKASVPLAEVFAKPEKNPKWTAAYERADIEVRKTIQIAKVRKKTRTNI